MATDDDEDRRGQDGQVDLSPAAIEQRLDEVGQLYELGIYLAQAKPVSPSPTDARDTPDDSQDR